jgi:hypothetical protein
MFTTINPQAIATGNTNQKPTRRLTAAVNSSCRSIWEHLETRTMLSAAVVTSGMQATTPSSATVVSLMNAAVQGQAQNAGMTVGTSSWQNDSIASQTAPFQLSFDAVPSQQNENAVVGLSNGQASAWTGLAAIVRFNLNNQIDVRNGSGYQADTTINYTANTSYHFRMVLNPAGHTYSVYVTPAGGTEVEIANNYSFRTEQANTSTLNNLSGYSTVGNVALTNITGAALTETVGASWSNATLPTQTGSFQLEWDAVPSQQGTDSVMGLSYGSASQYTQLAAIARFNSTNTIDARNGGAYQADNTLAYTANTSYHFRMVVDVSNQTYSLYVTPAGGS